jgi:hypothetical protein
MFSFSMGSPAPQTPRNRGPWEAAASQTSRLGSGGRQPTKITFSGGSGGREPSCKIAVSSGEAATRARSGLKAKMATDDFVILALFLDT